MSDNISVIQSARKAADFNFEACNISFNGCGFLGIYHVGVACALQFLAPQMEFINVCGASAGAMAAVCLLANAPMGKSKIPQSHVKL